MVENSTNINTGSTGGLGFAYRSYDRAYYNYPGVIHDATVIGRLGQIGREVVERTRMGVTRTVVRALVPENVLGELLETPSTSDLVESAVPTQHATHSNGRSSEPVWMMLAAVNHQSRQPIFPIEEMISDVDRAVRISSKSPRERVGALMMDGYQFVNHIATRRILEILKLWGNSFEWNEDGIRKLQRDLTQSKLRRPHDRSVWFTGLVEPGSKRLVALATAERLDIPLGDGRTLPIVESTEWRRSGDVRRTGFAAATVSHLNAQILNDIGILRPCIVAEANFMSGAHHVGFASGMEVPPRSVRGRSLPQMLIQNVRIGDGLDPDGTRDFTMMHLPMNANRTLYDPASRHAMLKRGI